MDLDSLIDSLKEDLRRVNDSIAEILEHAADDEWAPGETDGLHELSRADAAVRDSAAETTKSLVALRRLKPRRGKSPKD